MAQLMYYNKWPERGVGSHSYQWCDTTLYANFEEKEYRYDLMRDRAAWTWQTYTDEEADAQATINYHCGVAVDMYYSSNASGSYVKRNQALRTFFKYRLVKEMHPGIDREEYMIGEIVNALKYQQSPFVVMNDNHQFLVDGYRTGGFVHLNLGEGLVNCWFHISGTKDGWFDDGSDYVPCSHLKPTEYLLYLPDKDVRDVTIDGITYQLYASRASILDGKQASGNVNIPSNLTVDGKSYVVNDIPELCFQGNTAITSVSIPSVGSIGNGAFFGCTNLVSVKINGELDGIGYQAFDGCTSLETISLPKTMNFIGYEAFQGCSSLKNIEIPEGVETLDWRTFHGCSSLSDVTLPNSLNEIGHTAFSGCSSLKNINIPEGVTAIESFTFQNCSSLSSIKLPEGITKIDFGGFEKCSNLVSINIPKGLTYIGEQAFGSCI